MSPFRVVVLCTGNAARSLLGEALLAHLGGERFAVASAGTRPKGSVYPLALVVLAERGIATAGLRSKGIDELLATGARFDLAITVCDSAAAECPVFPGATVVHWGLEDPTNVQGSDETKLAAFRATADALARRLARLVALSDDELRAPGLAAKLAAVHRES